MIIFFGIIKLQFRIYEKNLYLDILTISYFLYIWYGLLLFYLSTNSWYLWLSQAEKHILLSLQGVCSKLNTVKFIPVCILVVVLHTTVSTLNLSLEIIRTPYSCCIYEWTCTFLLFWFVLNIHTHEIIIPGW